MFGNDPNYSSDEYGEKEGSSKVWESDERNRESGKHLSSHHNENAGSPEKKRTKVLDEETAASHMSVEPGVLHGYMLGRRSCLLWHL